MTLTPLGRTLAASFAWTLILFNARTISAGLSPLGCAVVAGALLIATYAFLRGSKLPPAAFMLLLLAVGGCGSKSKPPGNGCDSEVLFLEKMPFPSEGIVYHIPEWGTVKRTAFWAKDLSVLRTTEQYVGIDGELVVDTFFQVIMPHRDTAELQDFYTASAADSILQIDLGVKGMKAEIRENLKVRSKIHPIHAPQ